MLLGIIIVNLPRARSSRDRAVNSDAGQRPHTRIGDAALRAGQLAIGPLAAIIGDAQRLAGRAARERLGSADLGKLGRVDKPHTGLGEQGASATDDDEAGPEIAASWTSVVANAAGSSPATTRDQIIPVAPMTAILSSLLIDLISTYHPRYRSVTDDFNRI